MKCRSLVSNRNGLKNPVMNYALIMCPSSHQWASLLEVAIQGKLYIAFVVTSFFVNELESNFFSCPSWEWACYHHIFCCIEFEFISSPTFAPQTLSTLLSRTQFVGLTSFFSRMRFNLISPEFSGCLWPHFDISISTASNMPHLHFF